MARGAGQFSAETLQKLRDTRRVNGRRLSAEAVAGLVGTSKARILAYENGHSVPEASRVAQLAAIFGVNPRELYKPTKGPASLRDMRTYAGLTAAQVAELCGISRSTYRGVEQSAMVPPRYSSALPARLAEVLGHPLRMVERALEHHPATTERRVAISKLLAPLYKRAHVTHSPAAVDVDEPAVADIAVLLRRPTSVACRLVNKEMNVLRTLLLQRAVAEQSIAYAQTPRGERSARARSVQLGSEIHNFADTSASALDHFATWAVTCSEWRALVNLLNVSYVHVAETRADSDESSVWDGLITRGLVASDRSGNTKVYVVTTRGVNMVRNHEERYACLYPRVPAPRPHHDLARAKVGVQRR